MQRIDLYLSPTPSSHAVDLANCPENDNLPKIAGAIWARRPLRNVPSADWLPNMECVSHPLTPDSLCERFLLPRRTRSPEAYERCGPFVYCQRQLKIDQLSARWFLRRSQHFRDREVVLSSSRRVMKGPGRRPLSAKRQQFMSLRGRGWSIRGAAREIGISRTTAQQLVAGLQGLSTRTAGRLRASPRTAGRAPDQPEVLVAGRA